MICFWELSIRYRFPIQRHFGTAVETIENPTYNRAVWKGIPMWRTVTTSETKHNVLAHHHTALNPAPHVAWSNTCLDSSTWLLNTAPFWNFHSLKKLEGMVPLCRITGFSISKLLLGPIHLAFGWGTFCLFILVILVLNFIWGAPLTRTLWLLSLLLHLALHNRLAFGLCFGRTLGAVDIPGTSGWHNLLILGGTSFFNKKTTTFWCTHLGSLGWCGGILQPCYTSSLFRYFLRMDIVSLLRFGVFFALTTPPTTSPSTSPSTFFVLVLLWSWLPSQAALDGWAPIGAESLGLKCKMFQ